MREADASANDDMTASTVLRTRNSRARKASATSGMKAAFNGVPSLAHTSPVRLLLLICFTIVVTHSVAMLSIHRHAGVPPWIQSFGESVLLVVVLFPALYFFSFRPLIAQSTERLAAEANMRESEHKYRQLFENLGDAAFLVDVETFVRGGANRRADLQLRHLAREAADMARVAFPKSIQVELQLPNDLWPVRAEAAQLSQVIMNLAVNARDAMPEGGELRFAGENLVVSDAAPAAIPDLKPGRYAVLRVSDTGCGIAREHLEKIFDPFFTTKPVGKGTGLGLAIVRDIVRSHNGAVQVESSPGRGTTFGLFLPAVSTSLVDAANSRAEAMLKGNGELVLVADDEALVLEMARLALDSAGYRVLQASDGTEAVALAIERKSELKLAILDKEMPYLGGPATIRALHKAIPSLRIIEISGSMEAGEAARTANRAFLQKPFSAEQLLDAVHERLKT